MPIYLNGVRYSVAKISTKGDIWPTLQIKSINPSEITQQVTFDDGYDALGMVTVNAISKSYVGSEVRRITEDDLEPGDGVLLIPSGYYPEDISIEVTSGNSIDVQPLSITSNGTYTAPSGVAYSPVSVSVSVDASDFYTGTGTPAASFGSVGDFFFVTG